jgi:hypothetical protein
MGSLARNDRLRCAVRIAAALGVGVVVAGCGGGSSLPSISGSLPNWFSRSDTPAAQARAAATPSISLEDDCPSIDIRTGTGTLVNANKTQEPTANDVRYQLTSSSWRGSVSSRAAICGCGSAYKAAPW